MHLFFITLVTVEIQLINVSCHDIGNHDYVNDRFISSRRLLIDYGAWSIAISTLPRAANGMAVGYYNESIFLLGGGPDTYQLVEYDIMNDIFIDNGTTSLSEQTFGQAQFYTQINNILYMLYRNGDRFSIFNLRTKIFINDWNGIRLPITVSDDACISSMSDYLFIVGGHSSIALNSLQILNLSSLTWLNNVPSMTTARQDLSCIVHSTTNALYAIGGRNGAAQQFYNTVEMINVSNIRSISSEIWILYINNLLYTTIKSRVVNFRDTILVTSGRQQDVSVFIKELQIIDVINHQVFSGGALSYSAAYTGSIIVNDIVYVFGGYDETSTLNIWQYLDLSPTNSPSRSPSDAPSITPTVSSFSPSNMPSISPSHIPSVEATYHAQSTTMEATNVGYNSHRSHNEPLISMEITIIIILICTIILMIIFGAICYIRKFKNQIGSTKKSEQTEKNNIEIQEGVSNIDTANVHIDEGNNNVNDEFIDADVVNVINQTNIGN